MYSARREAPAPVIMDQVLQRILGDQLPGTLDYYSESLDGGRFPEASYREAFQTFLAHKYADRRFDVVIATSDETRELVETSVDGPFADVPMVFFGSPGTKAGRRSTGVTSRLDLSRTIALARRLQPETERVFVISGASAFDKWYEAEARQQLRTFEGSLEFVYWSGLPMPELLERVARVPSRSIVYPLMITEDGSGHQFLPLDSLERITAVANAPVYAWASPEIGVGAVGGSMVSMEVVATRLAGLALRVLRGEQPEAIPVAEIDSNINEVDWRLLQRWGISEALVPADTTVRFREPNAWSRYKPYIIGAIALVSLQTALIAGLLIQRERRRRSEAELRQSYQQNRDLAGRLITAQDNERTRIARDLHDDVSQQLAGVSISFSGLKQRLGAYQIDGELQEELAGLQQQTLALARNVRNLSHDLHPTVLTHLGLVKGLTSHCDRIEKAHGVAVRCNAEGDLASISPEAALCLYRIAQEALRNVVAHAGASRADVRLVRTADHVEMTITDDGRGFESSGAVRKGLGLVSITERAKIAGGAVDIITGAAKGTLVRATVPAKAHEEAGNPRRSSPGQVA